MRALDRCATCECPRFLHGWLSPRTDFREPWPGFVPYYSIPRWLFERIIL